MEIIFYLMKQLILYQWLDIIVVNFYKGKCFLYNDFNINKNKKDKIKEKKVLILEKRIGNNDEFNALVANIKKKNIWRYNEW